jgi:hypothetical protein
MRTKLMAGKAKAKTKAKDKTGQPMSPGSGGKPDGMRQPSQGSGKMAGKDKKGGRGC